MRARDNPFAVQRTDRLAYRLPAGTTWEDLVARWAALGHRGALVGPEGHGKTTLLEELERRLAERGLEPRRLTLKRPPDRDRRRRLAAVLAGVSRRHLLLVDGADLLGPASWWRLRRGSRTAGGLLVTAHHPVRLPTLVECRTSPVLLTDLVRELHPQGIDELAAELPALFERCRGNLRDALRALYDDAAGRR